MELRNELISLKQEMTGISIVDEFAKYAKLQRKYNKLESVLKDKGKIIIQYIYESQKVLNKIQTATLLNIFHAQILYLFVLFMAINCPK